MTECACIWQQWDKEKGGKMYYIIRDGYSVINEKDNIAFYDIKTKRMIFQPKLFQRMNQII